MSHETASTSQIHNKTGVLKGEESKVETGKVCEELMSKISKSDENHKPHASKLNELQHKKHEKNYKTCHNQNVQKQPAEKRHYVQRNREKNEGRFTVRIKMSEKIGEHYL